MVGGLDVAAEYDYRCWLLRQRYHVHSRCDVRTPREALAPNATYHRHKSPEPFVPVWAWEFVLLGAIRGECAMPDVSSPQAASA